MSQQLTNRLFCTAVEEDDSVEDVKDVVFASKIHEAEFWHCLFCNQNFKSRNNCFKEGLDGNEDSDNEEDEATLNDARDLPCLTENEFLQKHRMAHKSFNRDVKEIKLHSVLKKLEGTSGRPQTPSPVANQLMVLLKHLGTQGNGASLHDNIQSLFEGCLLHFARC